MAAGDVPRPDTDVAGPGDPPDLLAGPATSSIHAVGSPSLSVCATAPDTCPAGSQQRHGRKTSMV